tara:strand:+ start:1252 stop:1791 length:540 start_codon:yes stop_codon:yes gene_type:complete
VHLHEHGNTVTTDILLQSEFKDEVNETGRYFSTLWNIVSSADWANLIPETGAGNGNGGTMSVAARERLSERMSGENNISKTADFRRKHSGDNHWTKRPEHAGKAHIMTRPDVREKVSGKNSVHYNTTIYTFMHPIHGTVRMSAFDFRMTYHLDQSCVSRLITGKYKQYKEWKLFILTCI